MTEPCEHCRYVRGYFYCNYCGHAGKDAIPNRVLPGTFGPVFDAGGEEGKRQARHATPNSEAKLMEHEEAIRHLLDHYYGPARYFRNADIAISKLAEVMGDE